MVASSASRIAQAMALGLLLQQFGANRDGKNEGYVYVAILIVCGAIFMLAKQRQFFLTYRHGMQVRIGLVAALYDKVLNLPAGTTDAAHATNLCSNDVERFLMASVVGLFLWWGPVEAVVILVLGCRTLSTAGFGAGFAVFMAVLLPMQFWLSRLFARTRHQVATSTDARVQLVRQAVLGARVVKMNAWECRIQERIGEKRKVEMKRIRQSNR